MTGVLYKYRGIQNFRFLVDIILKNRLYAAKYSDLNDPMGGSIITIVVNSMKISEPNCLVKKEF